MSTTLIMETIQLFRQWAHERDKLECDEFIEICTEVDMIKEGNLEINDFQDYVYFDFTPVAVGVRIGVERLNPKTNKMFLDLDKGILFGQFLIRLSQNGTVGQKSKINKNDRIKQ